MSKWISDAYIKRLLQNNRLLQGNCEYKLWEQEVENTVDAMPSIDIVRCKECKYAHMTYGGDCKHCDMWKDDDDFYLELYLDGDFYCAYGEREGE